MMLRRDFLKTGSMAVAAATVLASTGATSSTRAAESAGQAAFRTKLYKAMVAFGAIDEAYCESLKQAGFEGMEATRWDMTPVEAAQIRIMADKFDLRIHSVMRGWAEFNHEDADQRRRTIEQTKHSIRVAAAYGADTILLVPCRTGGMAMPEPWDFRIDFDPGTLMVQSVAAGDNAPYQAYIEAQNRATEMSIEAIEELIPVAAREGVMIGVENVWNNLWVMPDFFAAFVRHFDNLWVKSYLDLGNHTRYARPELWVEALGRTLVKLHIKGFYIDEQLNDYGGGRGRWVSIDEASIDWIAVRNAIEKVQYNGWVTIEEGNRTLPQYSEILDRFFDGVAM